MGGLGGIIYIGYEEGLATVSDGVLGRVMALREAIEGHNRNYFDEGASGVGDLEFDGLVRELEELEAAHPEVWRSDTPTGRVGGSASGGAVHASPMLSLEKAYDAEALRLFGTE